MSIQKQCKILGLSRTAHYYKPKGESEENLDIMQRIDREHLKHPAKGVVGMTDHLLEDGIKVGTRRVRRLMRKMGIEAIYRRRSLSKLGRAVYNQALPAERTESGPQQPGLVYRHNIHPDEKGFYVLDCYYRRS